MISENTEIQAYDASIAAVGISIAFYYGMTGYACVVFYWKYLFKSVKNFVLVGLLPFVGAVMLTLIMIKTLVDSAKEGYGYGLIFGIGAVLVIGIFLLFVVGVPTMIAWQAKAPSFFRNRIDPVDQRPAPDGSGPSAPPLGSLKRGGGS